MTYWRMQLHPNRTEEAGSRAKRCLKRERIGLDFHRDVGDLREPHGEIDKGQRSYRLFLAEMEKGDLVLVQAGHDVVALVEVEGEYEYVPDPGDRPDLWFRHMRKVRNVRLYEDRVPNPAERERIPFRSTLMPIRRKDQAAFRLVERWRDPL